MSAFLCSASLLSRLATELSPMAGIPPETLYKRLLKTNLLSLAARYGQGTDRDYARKYRFDPAAHAKASTAQLVKDAHCFNYQACEFDGYMDSEDGKLIQAYMQLDESARLERTYEYESADWD